MKTLERRFKHYTVKYLPKKKKKLTRDDLEQWLSDFFKAWTIIQ